MRINQEKFFEGLDFEKIEIEYKSGKETCYKGIDGGFYRVDFFDNSYVIEYAENESEAYNNQFEDSELYDGTLEEKDIISIIRKDLIKFSGLDKEF